MKQEATIAAFKVGRTIHTLTTLKVGVVTRRTLLKFAVKPMFFPFFHNPTRPLHGYQFLMNT